MFTRQREKQRFQLDHAQPPTSRRREPPVTVTLAPRRKKPRFRVAPTDTPRWNPFPFRVVVKRRRWRWPVAMTLARRRQLFRVSLLAGSVLAIAAITLTTLLLNPSTRDALLGRNANAVSNAGSLSSRPALHYLSPAPFTQLQSHVTTTDQPAPALQAQSAFVFDPAHGWLLFQASPDQQYPAASLTKVMTLLVAVDTPSLDQPVTIGPDAAAMVNSNNSYMGVSQGEQLTLRNLLYGLILVGGNDAAIAIADAVAGNQEAFVELMNQRAWRLGLTHTHFATPDGVSAGDVTSASDMAKLSAIAMMNPEVMKITSTADYSIPQTPTHKAFHLHNTNDLLPGEAAAYSGANGVKTGFDGSQYCMAFSATVNGRLIVGAVMGEPSAQTRDADAHALLDWGFNQQ